MLDSPPSGGEPIIPPSAPESAPPPPEPVDRGPESAGSTYATTGEPSGAPAPPPAPRQQMPTPQAAALAQEFSKLQQLQQALSTVEQQDARLMAYGAQLPDAMAAEVQQRAAAMPYARRELALRQAGLELQAQKMMMEGPSRHVIQTFLTEQAAQQLPGLDTQDFYARLSKVQAPDDVPIVAAELLDLQRKFGGALTTVAGSTAQRLRRGVDTMGGPGGAGGADFSRMSESALYELGIKQSDARRGNARR